MTATIPSSPGKKLLIRSAVILLSSILAGMACGYLFLQMPNNIPAAEAGYLRLGLGFAYGLLVGFAGDLLLVALFFIHKLRAPS